MLEISEIMYDLKTGSDDGREWVEIRNVSNEFFDLSELRFFEGDTNHKIKIIQGDAKLSPQNYAVIVSNAEKFKADHSSFEGSILDSTFSLNNSGESLALKNGEAILDQYFYNSSVGGSGDGKSLQKINGVWSASSPTPGVENKIIFIPPPKPKVITPKSELVAKISKEEILVPEIPVKNSESLIASVNLATPTMSQSSNLYFYIIVLMFLIVAGIGAVYFLKKKKISPQIGEDFEIFEE